MNILLKVKKAQDVCFDEWKDNYNTADENLKCNRHNRLFPKLALAGMIILFAITLVVLI